MSMRIDNPQVAPQIVSLVGDTLATSAAADAAAAALSRRAEEAVKLVARNEAMPEDALLAVISRAVTGDELEEAEALEARRICPGCGVVFVPRNSTHAWCVERCRKRTWDRRNAGSGARRVENGSPPRKSIPAEGTPLPPSDESRDRFLSSTTAALIDTGSGPSTRLPTGLDSANGSLRAGPSTVGDLKGESRAA